MEQWRNDRRPGFFGRRKNEIIAGLNARWGKDNWRLVWLYGPADLETGAHWCTFQEACKFFYEESYYRYLRMNPADVRFICEYRECYDNAESNIESGLDYTKQESYSTHIQDIAMRNAMRRLGAFFTGANGKLLQIRGATTDGFRFGPGNLPYFAPETIISPSLRPEWALQHSVEDFWQSNKIIQVRT